MTPLNDLQKNTLDERVSSFDFIKFIIAFIITLFFISLVLQTSWNTCMPHIFKLPSVDIIQSFSLLVVSGLLLK